MSTGKGFFCTSRKWATRIGTTICILLCISSYINAGISQYASTSAFKVYVSSYQNDITATLNSSGSSITCDITSTNSNDINDFKIFFYKDETCANSTGSATFLTFNYTGSLTKSSGSENIKIENSNCWINSVPFLGITIPKSSTKKLKFTLNGSNVTVSDAEPFITPSCPTNSSNYIIAQYNIASTPKQILVSGSNLSSNVNVTVSGNDFEISSNNSDWGNSCTLQTDNGTISNSPIYTRLKASTSAGTKTATITYSNNNVNLAQCDISGQVDQDRNTTFNGIYPQNNITYNEGQMTNANTTTGWVKVNLEGDNGCFRLNFSDLSSGVNLTNFEEKSSDNDDYIYTQTSSDIARIDIKGQNGQTYKIGFTKEQNTMKYTLEPLITSTCPETSMTTLLGQNSSSVSFSVAGTGLDGNVTVSVNGDFQISNNNSSWGNSITLNRSYNYVLTQTLYVRMTGNSSGTKTGAITISSQNAETVTCQLTGTVIGDAPTVTINSCKQDAIQFEGENRCIGSINLTTTNILQEQPLSVSVANGFTISTSNSVSGSSSLSLNNNTSNTPLYIWGSQAGSTTVSFSYNNGTVISPVGDMCTYEIKNKPDIYTNCSSSIILSTSINNPSSSQQIPLSISYMETGKTVTITAPEDFEISKNETTWSNSLTYTTNGMSSIYIRLINKGTGVSHENMHLTINYDGTESAVITNNCSINGTISTSTTPTINVTSFLSTPVTTTNGTSVLAGLLTIETTNVSNDNKIQISAPSGFYISESSSNAGNVTSLELKNNVSKKTYYVWFSGNNTTSGNVIFKDNENNTITPTKTADITVSEFSFSGTVISASFQATECNPFFNSPVDFMSPSSGNNNPAPSGWAVVANKDYGYNGWCQEYYNNQNNYSYTINESDAYIYKDGINLTNSKTYKITVSTCNNNSQPQIKIFNNSELVMSVTSGTAFTFTGETGSTYSLRIGYGDHIYIKTVEMYEMCQNIPTITPSGNLASLTTTYQTPSSNRSFTATGTNMQSAITVTAPSGFEVSKDGNSFSGSVQTTHTSGDFSETIYIRLTSSNVFGFKSGSILLSANSAETETYDISGEVAHTDILTNNCEGKYLTTNAGVSGEASPFDLKISNIEPDKEVTITAPHGFEISKDGGTTWSESLTYTENGYFTVNIRLESALSGEYTDQPLSITYNGTNPTIHNSCQFSGSVIGGPTLSLTCPNNTLATAYNEASVSVSLPIIGSNITPSNSGAIKIEVSDESGFEISLSETGEYTQTIWIPSSAIAGDKSVNTSVFVRMAASTVIGSKQGTLTVSTANGDDKTCSLNGTVNEPTASITCPSTTTYITVNGTPSTQNTIEVTASNLGNNDLYILAPSGFEISTDGTNYVSSLNITPNNGNINQDIYLRYSGNAAYPAGNIELRLGTFDGLLLNEGNSCMLQGSVKTSATSPSVTLTTHYNIFGNVNYDSETKIGSMVISSTGNERYSLGKLTFEGVTVSGRMELPADVSSATKPTIYCCCDGTDAAKCSTDNTAFKIDDTGQRLHYDQIYFYLDQDILYYADEVPTVTLISPSFPYVCPGEKVVTITAPQTTGLADVITYQWYKKNGNTSEAISGATNSSYTVSDAGDYFVRCTSSSSKLARSSNIISISESCINVTFKDVSSSMNPYCNGSAITIKAQPEITNQQNEVITYQWYKNDTPIEGSTNADYSTTATNNTAGSYKLKVTVGSLSFYSKSITLTEATGLLAMKGEQEITSLGVFSSSNKIDAFALRHCSETTVTTNQLTAFEIDNARSFANASSNAKALTLHAVSDDSIFVRLKSGLADGLYNEPLIITDDNGESISIMLSGIAMQGCTGSMTLNTQNMKSTDYKYDPCSHSGFITFTATNTYANINLSFTDETPSYKGGIKSGDAIGDIFDDINGNGAPTFIKFHGESGNTYKIRFYIEGNTIYYLTTDIPIVRIVDPERKTVCKRNNKKVQIAAPSVIGMEVSSYQWKKDGTVINSANETTYTADEPGSYTVTCISNTGLARTSNGVILTEECGTINFTANKESYCEGDLITLTATVSGEMTNNNNNLYYIGGIQGLGEKNAYSNTGSCSYTYQIPAGTTSNIVFTTSVTDPNTLENVTATKTISRSENCPNISFSEINSSTNTNSFCTSTEIELSATITPLNLGSNTIKSFQWFKDGQAIQTQANPVVTTSSYTISSLRSEDAGVYKLRATLSNNIYFESNTYTLIEKTGNIEIITKAGETDIDTLTGFNYIDNDYAHSENTQKSFSLSADNYCSAVGVSINKDAALSHFEISVGNSNSFNGSKGNLFISNNPTLIYVRLKDGLTAGNYSENLIIAQYGTNVTKTINLTGTVTASCYERTIASWNFGENTTPTAIAQMDTSYTNWISELPTYDEKLSSWAIGYSITDGNGDNSLGDNLIPNTTGGQGNRMLVLGLPNTNNNQYYKLFTIKNSNIDEGSYLLSFKAQNYSKYKNTAILRIIRINKSNTEIELKNDNQEISEIQHSGASSNIYWKTYSIVVDNNDISSGIDFEYQGGGNGVAFDDITFSRVCPPSITFSITGDPCSSDNATLTANVQGGSGVYQYLWKKDDETQNSTTETLQLSQGAAVYSLTVTDGYGQTAQKTYTVDCSPTIQSATASATSFCANDEITLTFTGQNFSGFIITGIAVQEEGDPVILDISDIENVGSFSCSAKFSPKEEGSYKWGLIYSHNSIDGTVWNDQNLTITSKQLCSNTLSLATNSTNVCGNSTEILANLATPINVPVTYQLQIKEGNNYIDFDHSTIDNTFDISQAGTYRARAYVTANPTDTTNWAEITISHVNFCSGATIDIFASKKTVCTGDIIQLSAQTEKIDLSADLTYTYYKETSIENGAVSLSGNSYTFTNNDPATINFFATVTDGTTTVTSNPIAIHKDLLCGKTLILDENEESKVLCDKEGFYELPVSLNIEATSVDAYGYVLFKERYNMDTKTYEAAITSDSIIFSTENAEGTILFNITLSPTTDTYRYTVDVFVRKKIDDDNLESKLSKTILVQRKPEIKIANTLTSEPATPSACELANLTVSVEPTKSLEESYIVQNYPFDYVWKSGNSVLESGTYLITENDIIRRKINFSLANQSIVSNTSYTFEITGGCTDQTQTFNIESSPCNEFSIQTLGYCNGAVTIDANYTGTKPLSSMNISWTNVTDGQRASKSSSGTLQLELNGLDGTTTYSYEFKAIDKQTGVVIYTETIEIAPRTDCVLNYFVREDATGSNNGTSWDNAFTTIQAALNAAETYHANVDETKDIAIYISNIGTYSINKVVTLNRTSIFGGYDDQAGNNTESATGHSSITQSLSIPCFKIGEGDITLSRLSINEVKGARVITSARKGQESITLQNCQFTNNNYGALLFDSPDGGSINIFDCKFEGNNKGIGGNGGALYIDGPYDLRISSLKDKKEWAGTKQDITILSENCNGNNLSKKTLTLLNLEDTTKATNIFNNNMQTEDVGIIKGGAVYIHKARSVVVENAIFADNRNTRGGASYGCGLYIDSTDYVSIERTYFFRSYDLLGYGGGLCFISVPKSTIELSLFKDNKLNEGLGGAFAGMDSRMDLINSAFESNIVAGNNGAGGGFYATNSALINIVNSKFSKNKMPSGKASGGGAYVKGAVVNISNAVFEQNYAQENGGAFYAGGNADDGGYDPKTLISVYQSVFKENLLGSGSGLAGAICAENMDIIIKNSYFYKNNAREKSGPVTVTNGNLRLFASTFFGNRATTQNAVAGAILVNGHPEGVGAKNPNAYIYNSTFTGNGGAERGIIGLEGYAYADIVSCTITDNNGQIAEVDASGNMTDNSTLAKLSGGVYLDGSATRANILNCIISNNLNSAENKVVNLKIGNSINEDALEKTTQLLTFKYNTLGENIYYLTGGTKIMDAQQSYPSASCDKSSISSESTCNISEFNCDNITFTTDDLYPICNYGAPVAPTRPFKFNGNNNEESSEDIHCRDYGMSVNELENYHYEDEELKAELMQDEHRSVRGWRRLCLKCDATSEDIKGSFRTYQGAVEGGVGVYDGKKFDIELRRMVGQCSGGSLAPAYINIRVLKSNADNESISTDSLERFYKINVYRVFQNGEKKDTILFYSQERIKCSTINGENCIRLENTPSGIYSVLINRYDSIFVNGTRTAKIQETHTAAIEVESITETAMAWIGGVSTDFNDKANWRYRDEDGNIIMTKEVAAPPSACFDIHIGLDDPSSPGKTVTVLPTIKESDKEGACADIYFHPNGSLGQINKLSYKKAHVEMEVEAYSRNTSPDTKWYMISAPLKGMVSGDYLYQDRAVYIRYFNIRKNDENSYFGEWTYSVANVGESLSNLGMGYAFRYFTKKPSYYMDDKITYSFPKEDLSYSYYDGTQEKVRESTSFRFLPENESNDKIPDVTEIKINLIDRGFYKAGNQMGIDNDNAANGYVIVGNPFMSHIDLLEFYQANKEAISSDIKVYVSPMGFETYQITEKDGILSGLSTGDFASDYNRYIAPMQSFFVKPLSQAGESITLKLPVEDVACAMNNDNGSLLRSNKIETNKLGIQAKYDKWKSSLSYVIAKEMASNRYLDHEDSQKLLYSGSMVDIYTNNGNIAMDCNILDIDSLEGLTIPVSILVYKDGIVTVSISSISGFEAADNIFWIDSLTNQKTSLKLQSEFKYDLKKGTTENRFYIGFDQKKRVKVEITDTTCLGNDYVYGGGMIQTNYVGDLFKRELKSNTSEEEPDTVYYVNLKVNPTYSTFINDSIFINEEYKKNGFNLSRQDNAGLVLDTLLGTCVTGCDSITYLKLKVKDLPYTATVYYGNTTPIQVKADSVGNGLNLTNNALAYFEDKIPESLRKITNVIAKDGNEYYASKIIISDSADLYIPYNFSADSIIYTRKPSIYADRSRGWETIVLPFTATDFHNSGCAGNSGLSARNLIPFNKSDDVTYGDFWLKKFVSSKSNALGFDYPDKPVIEAYEPYIVAYPGNSWGAEYDMTGQTIRYSATMAKVSATPDPIHTETDYFHIYGTTSHAAVNHSYLLNSNSNQFEYIEYETTVPPFRSFVIAKQIHPSPFRSLSIYNEEDINNGYSTLGSIEASGPDIFVVYEKGGELCIYSSQAGETNIYDVNARMIVMNVKYSKGETVIPGLHTGIYLVKNCRVFINRSK